MVKEVALVTENPVLSCLHGWVEASLRFVRRQPLGAAGLVIILIMAFAALMADGIAPHDPLKNDYAAMFQPPSASHWFGTDAFGRDVLSRILYGSRTALWIGFSSSFFSGINSCSFFF